MSLYNRGRNLMTRLADKYGQGDTVYIEQGSVTGTEQNPVVEPDKEHPFNSFKASTNRKNQYVAGGYIVESDVLLLAENLDFAPAMDGKVRLNGREHQIVMLDPITNETPPLGWYIGIRS